MTGLSIDTDRDVIFRHIHRLWSATFVSDPANLDGDLSETAYRLLAELPLSQVEAVTAVALWKRECRHAALLDALWTRFEAAMQGHWDSKRASASSGIHQLRDRRYLVIRKAEDLISRMMDHFGISERAAAGQVNDWLSLARSWLYAPARATTVVTMPEGER